MADAGKEGHRYSRNHGLPGAYVDVTDVENDIERYLETVERSNK